eukprot:4390227-Pleurochrysis_carterae.AAC.1
MLRGPNIPAVMTPTLIVKCALSRGHHELVTLCWSSILGTILCTVATFAAATVVSTRIARGARTATRVTCCSCRILTPTTSLVVNFATF